MTCDFVRTFPICRELAMLCCTCHRLCAVKDKIVDLDGVELNGMVMESRDAELVECFAKK